MSALDNLVANGLREPLAAAQVHAQRGGRAIGFFGSEIPVELIIAAGAFPLRLPSAVQSNTDAADSYLESSFMPEVRSIAEQYLQGAFDFLDSIILPRSNDSAQRLYYYLSELHTQRLRRAPIPLIYDSAKIPRDSSKLHSRAATRRLAAELGTVADALPGAVEGRNRRRRLFFSAAKLRRGGGAPSGAQLDRIFRASDLCDADAFDTALSEWLPTAERFLPKARIVLAGSAPPDERLHRAVEQAGGNIVAESDAHASSAVSQPAIPADGSCDAIADHYYALANSTRAFVDRAAAIQNLAADAAADGVIIWLVEEEDALIWDLPAVMSALQARGVAALRLVRRRWDAGDGALEEIKSFTRALGGAA
jgi:benzoyl-CoA reductase/2-hydroxyglutaryl-CoA dehydratase subunit BcrC/BadD/HgdB